MITDLYHAEVKHNAIQGKTDFDLTLHSVIHTFFLEKMV